MISARAARRGPRYDPIVRPGLASLVAVGVSFAAFTSAAAAEPARARGGPGDGRRSVQITESSAVVLALECPAGARPVWQPVRVYSNVALPELEWLGVGRTRICGVEVRGLETQVILACQRADGTHDGPVGTWYPSGEKRTEGRCENGAAQGVWRRYRRDGWLELEGHYERGARVGEWMLWEPGKTERALSLEELRESPPVF